MASRKRKRCRSCSQLFRTDPRSRFQQKYCAKPACQNTRQRLNEKSWRLKNPDCLAYQRKLTREWFLAHPAYSRNRRHQNPKLCQANRNQTRQRMRKIRSRRRFDKSKSILTELTGNKVDKCCLSPGTRWLHLRLTKASRFSGLRALWDNAHRLGRKTKWRGPERIYDLTEEIVGNRSG